MAQFNTFGEASDYLKRMGVEEYLAPIFQMEAAEKLYKAVDEMIDGYSTLIQHHHEHHTEHDTELAAATKIIRQAAMNCSIDNHGGGEDMDCRFCAEAGSWLATHS